MLLDKIFGYLVIRFEAQDVEKEAVLSAIGEYLCKNKVSPMPLVKGVLNTLIDYEEYKIVEKNGIITFVSYDETEEKGGEKMTTKKDFTNKMTSGEEKVAKSVLNHFKQGFKVRNPSRITFESCLETAFPKIKNGKAATTNLINKNWLKEVDGKIFIGPEGEKYLSP